MCTVTYFPTKTGAIITSNRDENAARGNTLEPATYYFDDQKIVYPKDEKSSGTWIAYNQNNCVAVLLNGALDKHIPNRIYKQSRGFIITAILKTNNPIETIDNIDFEGIEPFTIILYTTTALFEYRWNSIELFKKQIDLKIPHIWSSSTLYNKEIIEKNVEDYSIFIQRQNDITAGDILVFHQTKKYEVRLPLQSKINNIKTISITQIQTTIEASIISYYDLIKLDVSVG